MGPAESPPPGAGPADEGPWLEASASRDFPAWLAENRVSLAFTTYQTAKLFLIGLRPDGRVAIFERTFQRCMGLWADDDAQTLWMSTHYQVWRFANILRPGQSHQGCDRLYVPRVGHTTGDLDVHDIAADASGRPIFVATRFNCLATTGERDSLAPLWRPPFVTGLVAEDRCHLNGLAMEGGRPRYATAISTSDVTDGWRDRRADGGVVVDVDGGEVVARGLSMPHSPRLYRGRLWVLNSGTGHLGSIDPAVGRFEPLAFCPGYLRGLAFVGDYAVVGLSRPRREGVFGGLALDENLAARGATARSGLHVIDLRTGDTPHWLRVEGMVRELYDVVVLPGAIRPMAFGFKTDEIARYLTLEGSAGHG